MVVLPAVDENKAFLSSSEPAFTTGPTVSQSSVKLSAPTLPAPSVTVSVTVYDTPSPATAVIVVVKAAGVPKVMPAGAAVHA